MTLNTATAHDPMPFFIEKSRFCRSTKLLVIRTTSDKVRVSHRWETSFRRECKRTDWLELRYWIQLRTTASSSGFHKRCDSTSQRRKRWSDRESKQRSARTRDSSIVRSRKVGFRAESLDVDYVHCMIDWNSFVIRNHLDQRPSLEESSLCRVNNSNRIDRSRQNNVRWKRKLLSMFVRNKLALWVIGASKHLYISLLKN